MSLRFLMAEFHRVEREATGQQLVVVDSPIETGKLLLSTCPDYNDAVSMLLDLRDGELTLQSQHTCRRLRVMVERLAVDVARADLQRRGARS